MDQASLSMIWHRKLVRVHFLDRAESIEGVRLWGTVRYLRVAAARMLIENPGDGLSPSEIRSQSLDGEQLIPRRGIFWVQKL